MSQKEPLHSDDGPDAGSAAILRPVFRAGGDNFRDNNGDSVFAVNQSVSYTQVSRRGEVAERLKAADC